MAVLPACGSDDPVQVVDDGGLGGEETRRPAVPTPKKNSDGTYDIPDVSEVTTIIRPLTTDLEEYVMGGFSPIIESAKADWVVRRQDCEKSDFGSTDCNNTYEVISSKTFSATYIRGVETTETRTTSFALAVSVEGSLGKASKLKSIAGSLSGSYTQSSESSKTVSEATETKTTTTIEGFAGKEILLQVWHLVERYTITDRNGEPFQDPNYRFKDEFFILSGVAVKDQTTIFDK